VVNSIEKVAVDAMEDGGGERQRRDWRRGRGGGGGFTKERPAGPVFLSTNPRGKKKKRTESAPLTAYF
jgi:hypothetical protein